MSSAFHRIFFNKQWDDAAAFLCASAQILFMSINHDCSYFTLLTNFQFKFYSMTSLTFSFILFVEFSFGCLRFNYFQLTWAIMDRISVFEIWKFHCSCSLPSTSLKIYIMISVQLFNHYDFVLLYWTPPTIIFQLMPSQPDN